MDDTWVQKYTLFVNRLHIFKKMIKKVVEEANKHGI